MNLGVNNRGSSPTLGVSPSWLDKSYCSCISVHRAPRESGPSRARRQPPSCSEGSGGLKRPRSFLSGRLLGRRQKSALRRQEDALRRQEDALRSRLEFPGGSPAGHYIGRVCPDEGIDLCLRISSLGLSGSGGKKRSGLHWQRHQRSVP